MPDKSVTIEVGDGAAIPRAKDKGLVSAWWISFIGAIACLLGLLIFKPDPYVRLIKFLPDGIIVTFQVTIASIALAIIIGLFTGLGRISRNRFINLAASTYDWEVNGSG